MIKVSVIIPIYNMEKHIDKCLNSVINQSLEEIEIILIDDGSTDNSLKICNLYKEKDKRVKVYSKDNSGVSSARNMGIKKSKGKYLTFIDPDDYIEKNMLKDMYEKIEYDKSELVICDYTIDYINSYKNINLRYNKKLFLDNEIVEKFILPFIGVKEFGDEFWMAGFRSPWGKLYKKNIISNNNIFFNEKLKIGEDVIFNLKYLICIKSISYINKNYYNYVKNDTSVMNRYKKDYLEICENYVFELENIIKKYKLGKEAKERLAKEKLKSITLIIKNECSLENKKSLLKKIFYLKKVTSSNLAYQAIKENEYNKLPYLQKIRINLIKYKMNIILYIYYKII
ncbi:glycosyltransferase [uncultured Clostridium sp.]|uniref:glycosyltransferase n=1 Tax=uncultured Clostridium sp. TaxID=59620 RepID=UPI0025D8EE66|nr:glycosyltransferase [uncultured Clostridium sp.]